MRKKKIKILHVAQAAGGVDRYIRMLLKYLDKEKFENILVCSQDFNREDYDGLVDSFEQIEMNRAIGVSDLNSIKEVRRLIKKYNPDAHFVIVGSGNQEAEIRKYAEENKFADSLHITGWVDDPMSYVELFDVACLLSRWEGFGLALPEYMMAGKPIVASRVDAIPNIIRNGENGLLVEVDDATGASEAVLQIYRDRSLKDKLVSKGVEDVHNRFDAQRVSEEHGILFENMWKVETI